VSYYKVLWKITDADGLVGDLDALSVRSLDVSLENAVWEDKTGLNSKDGIELYYYPGHLYQSTWNRDAYLEASYQPSPWVANVDGQIMAVKLATKQVTKQRTVYSEIGYDPTTDILYIQTWLQEEEKLLPKTKGLQSCQVNIFGKNDVLVKTFDLDADAADSSGVFWLRWSAPNLDSSESYFARFRIQYEGAFHYGGKPFDIRQATKMKDINTAIAASETAIKTQTAQQATIIQAKVDTSAADIKSKIDSTRSSLETKVDTTKTSIENKVTTIGSEITSAVTASTDQIKKETSSRIMNEQSFIKTGETLTVKYQSVTGLSSAPSIVVYSPKNSSLLIEGVMAEEGTTGIYAYDVKFIRGWGIGTFTIVCSETTYGTIDGISIDVIRANLDDINSAATIAMSSLAGIDTTQIANLATSITTVSQSVGKVIGTIADLSTMGDTLTQLSANMKKAIYDELSVASEKMQEIAKQSNIKIDQMLEVSKEGSQDINYVKKKALEIQAATELTQDIVERTNDQPITQTWLEPGS